MSDRAVILAPNWLGDAVMALPAIADVRRGLPQAAITVAARPAIAPLFRLVSGINEIVVLDEPSVPRRPGAWRSMGASLGAHGFEVALLLPNSFHAAMLASRAGIRERWGYATDWRGRLLLTRAVDPPPPGLHLAAYYQQLAAALGFPNGSSAPRIEVPPETLAAGARALESAGWDGRAPLVALAPGAAYGGAKRWPPERFAELAHELAADGVVTVMVGSGADATAGEQILGALDRRDVTLNLIGGTDLPTLAGVLANCRAIVSNDSGAMHLAAAAGIRVTAVFGPTNEHETGPLGASHAILSHPVWCRPCMLRECPLDHRCMRGVSVGPVLDATRQAL